MKVYLVGGAVRDQLLSLPIVERDWVVVGAEPEELLELGYRQVGKDFPVFIHPDSGDEYALARTERKSGKGHRGFKVHSEPTIKLEDDLSRRDLTINAIAEDSEGHLIDPYGGQKDLKQKVLRHISPAFSEDPLRVLRVARFAAKFWGLGFTISPETLNLMSKISNSDELSTLSKERIWKETERALESDNPEIFFITLWQVGALHTLVRPLAEALNSSNNLLMLADIRNLSGITSRYLGLSIIAEAHDNQPVAEQFNQAFCAPSKLHDFTELIAKCFYQCINALSSSEENIYETLIHLDAFRRESRCIEFLSCLDQIQMTFKLGENTSIKFLRDIIPELAKIKPDQDMKSLSGKEIGDSLANLRINKIRQLKTYKNK